MKSKKLEINIFFLNLNCFHQRKKKIAEMLRNIARSVFLFKIQKLRWIISFEKRFWATIVKPKTQSDCDRVVCFKP